MTCRSKACADAGVRFNDRWSVIRADASLKGSFVDNVTTLEGMGHQCRCKAVRAILQEECKLHEFLFGEIRLHFLEPNDSHDALQLQGTYCEFCVVEAIQLRGKRR